MIKHTIREFRPNEIFASQWIDLLMRHSMKSTKDNDLWAEPTLTELIDNNKVILENRIKLETISRFVDMLKVSEKHEKYVKLLRALINCDGEAVIQNQEEITNQILCDPETKILLLLPIRNFKDKIQI